MDTTKRCNNGQDYLVKTYEGRVETEDIKKDLAKKQHGFFIKKRPERNVSLRGSRFGGTYEHIRCRDYRKPTSCPCTIKTNRKRRRPPKRKRALEYQPGEMPSPEKVSKKARVEENDDDDIFEDAFEACL